jgi:hypothetical protein
MRWITFLAGLTVSSTIGLVAGAAQDFARETTALNLIQQAAASICSTVQQGGQQSEAKVSGDVQAQLNGVIARVADLGIKGAGELRNEEYQGVLRAQLADAIKTNTDCRKGVFDKLVERLLPPPGPPPAPPPVPGKTLPPQVSLDRRFSVPFTPQQSPYMGPVAKATLDRVVTSAKVLFRDQKAKTLRVHGYPADVPKFPNVDPILLGSKRVENVVRRLVQAGIASDQIEIISPSIAPEPNTKPLPNYNQVDIEIQ